MACRVYRPALLLVLGDLLPGWLAVCLALAFGGIGGGRCHAADAMASGEGSASATPTAVRSDQVRVLEFIGRVEVWPAPAAQWQALSVSNVLVLSPGDQLRTGHDSRATLQFSDHSVFRLNQDSRIEIRPADRGVRSLLLRVGELFFLDREKPSRIRLESPTTTSAIRGTEFLLAVAADESTTTLTLLDGAVDFSGGGQTVPLSSGQEATWQAGAPLAVRPLILAPNRVQWALYYPAVLEPAELDLAAAESARFTEVLQHYRAGDLPAALAAAGAAGDLTPDASLGARAFLAALRLAAGRTESAEALLRTSTTATPAHAPWAQSLREVLAATRGEELAELPAPTSVSEGVARSYYLQSRTRLVEARDAAHAAVERGPETGFAWVRLAELEWSLGRRAAATTALAEGQRRSPRNPRAWMLQGYLELAAHRSASARAAFEEARRLDGSLGEVWLGLGSVARAEGDELLARQHFETAAALEPSRAILRSYLARTFGELREDALAEREFDLAARLDPQDPTAWFYRGLWAQSNRRLNEAVRDLETAVDRNDNRAVFRSRLGLDEDRAARRADLSLSYAEVGLNEVAERSASRAVQDRYADFSGHLFRARSLAHREDPGRFELTWEAARQNQQLVANLLAPANGSTLGLQLTPQDVGRAFEGDGFGASTLATYRSGGDWEAAASLYGTAGRLGYAVDGQIASLSGDQRPRGQDLQAFSVQAKQELTAADGVYVQAGYLHREGGDLSRLLDPGAAIRGYQFEESEAPSAYLGYHRAWSPEQHTLVLVSRLEDQLTVRNPAPEILFLKQRGGAVVSLEADPFFASRVDSRFPLTSVEAQHLVETDAHTLVLGGRYQAGEFDVEESLVRSPAMALSIPRSHPDYADAAGYAYYTWRGWQPLRVTAGVAVEDVRTPTNLAWPPLGADETETTQVSPKLGLSYTPWTGGYFRAAFTESLGGQDFAPSVRLEPSELAGFVQSGRGWLPASTAGLAAGQRQRLYGVGFDQSWSRGTYAGAETTVVESRGRRSLGVVGNTGLLPVPDTTGQLSQDVEFREQEVAAYVGQLLGERWSFGARYAWSHAQMETGYPDLPPTLPGVAEFSADTSADLHRVQLFGGFHHENGLFAEWLSEWWAQRVAGYADGADPTENFWQHHVWVGYRFPHRRAEVRFGVLNLTGQDYRLRPLNAYREPWRERTFELSLRLNF